MIRTFVELIFVLLFSAAVPCDAADVALPVKVDVEGKFIEQLRLVDRGGREWHFTKPGPTLNLLEGDYRVVEVILPGSRTVDSGSGGWLTVRRGEPCRLVAGAPLMPRVKVERHGTVLQMDHELVDAEGRKYTSATTNVPPQVTISRDGQVVHSGSFEYG